MNCNGAKRFGKSEIHSSYLCTQPDYVACHNQAYVHQYQLLEGIKENGTFVLNCTWDDEELAEHLPREMKEELRKKKIRFYTINAFDLAEQIGLGKRINMIMQSCFFALTGLMEEERYVRLLKEEVVKNYGNRGESVVNKNHQAIDAAKAKLHQVDVEKLFEKERAPSSVR